MHWTLATLAALTALCLAGNVWRAATVGSVRWVGLAVCGAWAAQQYVWWASGGWQPGAMWLACDAAIITLAWAERHWTAWAIAALMPVCWACQIIDYGWGPGSETWWTNWTAVAVQMALGLPWRAYQQIGHEVSHGPLRGVAV